MNSKKSYPKYMERRASYNNPKDISADSFLNLKLDENLASNVVSTSERRILFYKTKICPWYIKGKCERNKTCLYAHAQNELRQLPNLCKTSLCPKLKINELCNDKKCKYAHTNIELRATENLYKTALCESYIKGKCFAGQFCRYAHGTNELRENPMEITDRNIIIGTSKHKHDKGIEMEKKRHSTTNNTVASCNGNGSAHINNKTNKHNKNKNNNTNTANNNNNNNNINTNNTASTNNNNNTNGSNTNGIGKNANFRKSVTFCIHAKKKEIGQQKFKGLKESNSFDLTENMDKVNGNELSAENSLEGNRKRDLLAKKKKKILKKFVKSEESINFSEEQFFNDNLNVLGFLEEQNNMNGEAQQYQQGAPSCNEQISGSVNNNCSSQSSSTQLNGNVVNNNGICRQNNRKNKCVYNENKAHISSNSSNNNSGGTCYYQEFDLRGTNTRDHLDNSMAMHFTMPNESVPTGNTYSSGNINNDSNLLSSSILSNSHFADVNDYIMENTLDNNSGYNDFIFNDGSMYAMNRNGNINSMSTINNMNNGVNSMHSVTNVNDMVNFNGMGIGMGMTNISVPSNMSMMMNNGNSFVNVQATNMNQQAFEQNRPIVPNMNTHNKFMGHFKCEKNNENSSTDSWDMFPLADKTKSSESENDYFKIFNYGIYNNMDKKLYENCEVYKNHMEQLDKSLFIQ